MHMDAVSDIKQRLAIEDVIGNYVELKRAGRNFKGLSPFQAEKTPSFVVSPEKQIWHDFSSGKGGDMFSFVMLMEGIEFKEALQLLARRAGVDLDQYENAPQANSKQKDRLYELLELAAKFYQVQFSKHKDALEYILKKREFTKETALEFRIGYAPNIKTALASYAKKQGFSDEELSRSGLVSRFGKSTYDMFRGRIVVPLMDKQGRVIGFTARLLHNDANAPKYINTPQTLLYDKSRHVFGLHLAKEAIRKKGYAILVEGNLDVIAAHQAGTRQVVATAGTALTDMQLKILKSFTGDIRLCFDQDNAGQTAAERAIPVASKVGISLSMLTIPSGKDPDDLIRQDLDAWQKIIDQPQYAMDWLIQRYLEVYDTKSAQGVRGFSDAVMGMLALIQDSVEQDHYIGKIAGILGVSNEALRAKLTQANTKKSVKLRSATDVPAKQDLAEDIVQVQERQKLQDHWLALLLFQPALRVFHHKVERDMLLGTNAQQVFQFILDHPDIRDKQEIANYLQDVREYVTILQLQYEELYQGLELVELRDEAARLQARLIQKYVKNEKNRLSIELQHAEAEQATQLLEQVKKLDLLLKQHA
jgi:DNA primase